MNEKDRDRTAQVPAPLARRGVSGLEHVKTAVADALHSAAVTINKGVARDADVGRKLGGYGRAASDWLEKSADYVRDADAPRIAEDIRRQVRSHPVRSVLIAGAVGLVLGSLLRKK